MAMHLTPALAAHAQQGHAHRSRGMGHAIGLNRACSGNERRRRVSVL
jgi:hypothetical protein